MVKSKRRFIEDYILIDKRDLEKELDEIILRLKSIRKELKRGFEK